MKIFTFALFMGLVLFAGMSPVYGDPVAEPEAAISSITDSQLDAYVEVSRILSANPAISREEMEATLKKNALSKEDFDSIDKQVQANADLKKKVQERLGGEPSVAQEMPKSPEVKTKLKESAAEEK